MTKSIFERKLDLFYVFYFLLHVVISVVIDSTIALPREYQLPIQQQLGDFHISMNKDLLVASRPIWLQAFVWLELVFQVPFFLGGAYGLIYDIPKTYLWCLVYTVVASVTTFGCLAEIVYLDGISQSERINLFFVYLPTCALPAAMAVDFWTRISVWVPSTTIPKVKKQ